MQSAQRAAFGTEELAVVLSHYDLGVIESITEFRRGSRRSPKVGIVSQGGKFLLKRRPADRVDLERVHFTHRVQLALSAADFPVPRLIPTTNHGRNLLRIREHIYEVFEFVRGQPGRVDECGADEARDAGRVLGVFHEAVGAFEVPDEMLPHLRGGYHDAAYVRNGLMSIGTTLSARDSFSGDEAELATSIQLALEAYDKAAGTVNRSGFEDEPRQLVHGDWHPGNLVFLSGAVAAVTDFDAMKLSRRVTDIANGVLQFSLIGGGDPDDWPDQLDEKRFAAFLEGYASVAAISPAQHRCIPHLMIEALTAECVPPITETGSVGRWSGNRVLRMVRRKCEWIANSAERLASPPASA